MDLDYIDELGFTCLLIIISVAAFEIIQAIRRIIKERERE